jgi:hypothetical protein
VQPGTEARNLAAGTYVLGFPEGWDAAPDQPYDILVPPGGPTAITIWVQRFDAP